MSHTSSRSSASSLDNDRQELMTPQGAVGPGGGGGRKHRNNNNNNNNNSSYHNHSHNNTNSRSSRYAFIQKKTLGFRNKTTENNPPSIRPIQIITIQSRVVTLIVDLWRKSSYFCPFARFVRISDYHAQI